MMAAENKNRQRGFTLTEIAIVLAIVGLIVGSNFRGGVWRVTGSQLNQDRMKSA